MKINSNSIKILSDKIISRKIKGVLFFGPDPGVAELCFRQLIEWLNTPDIQLVTYEDFVQDPQAHLMNLSLFADKSLLKIREVHGSFDKSLKEMLAADPVSIPCFFADELPPTSAIRKFFEASDEYAAIGCYSDDHLQVGKIIQAKLRASGKQIDADALRFLEHHLTGNRMIILNELEKLISYAAEHEIITLTIVEEVISTGVTASADMLCIHFALSDVQSFEEEVDKLFKESISSIWIIRALIRYHIRLYMVLLQHEYGVPQAQAMKSLKPPIFFKYVPAFKSALERTNHAKVISRIKALCALEISIKQGNMQEMQVANSLSLMMLEKR